MVRLIQLGTMPDQHLYNIHEAMLRCGEDRGVAFVVDDIYIGPEGKQRCDDLSIADLCCKKERCRAVFVLFVYISAVLQQNFHSLCVSVL